MTTFRILDQRPQYFLDDGRPNAGGFVYFFESHTNTPKDTWNDKDKSSINPHPIQLDAAGRTTVDVWGEGAYYMQVQDADHSGVWNIDDVIIPGGEANSLPPPALDEFLVGDGSQYVTRPILEVPDVTGQAGKQLGTDGTLPFWEAKPTIPTVPTGGISVTGTTVVIGDRMLQMGTSSIPANGAEQSSTTVTFPTAFGAGSPPIVMCQIGPSASMMLSHTLTTLSATAFGITAGGNIPGIVISAPQPFMWQAWGPKP